MRINLLMHAIRDNFIFMMRRDDHRLAYVDGIRAIAVIYVLILHLFWCIQFFVSYDIYERLFNHNKWLIWVFNGALGVDMFFVISGFLIANLLLNEKQATGTLNIKKFYMRRFLRLAPVYYLALIVVFAYSSMIPSEAHRTSMLWTNILYIQNFFPFQNSLLGLSWSLAVEEQFYLFFPLAMLLFCKLKINTIYTYIVLLFFSIISAVFAVIHYNFLLPKSLFIAQNPAYFYSVFNNLYQVTYLRIAPILCGIIVAYLVFFYNQKTRSFLKKYHWIPFIVFLLIFIQFLNIAISPVHFSDYKASYAYSVYYMSNERNVFAVSIALILLFCVYPYNSLSSYIKKILSLNFWYPIANISYSLYLFSYMVIIFFYSIFMNDSVAADPIKLAALMVVVTLISVLVSVLLFITIEKPFMNLRKSIK